MGASNFVAASGDHDAYKIEPQLFYKNICMKINRLVSMLEESVRGGESRGDYISEQKCREFLNQGACCQKWLPLERPSSAPQRQGAGFGFHSSSCRLLIQSMMADPELSAKESEDIMYSTMSVMRTTTKPTQYISSDARTYLTRLCIVSVSIASRRPAAVDTFCILIRVIA